MIDINALFNQLEGKRFHLHPPLEEQPAGAIYVALKAYGGGIEIKRLQDGYAVWVPDQIILEYKPAAPSTQGWDGTLMLSSSKGLVRC